MAQPKMRQISGKTEINNALDVRLLRVIVFSSQTRGDRTCSNYYKNRIDAFELSVTGES